MKNDDALTAIIVEAHVNRMIYGTRTNLSCCVTCSARVFEDEAQIDGCELTK